MFRTIFAVSSLVGAIAITLSQGTSEQQNNLRLQSNPTWLSINYYPIATDLLCTSTPSSNTAVAMDVCESFGSFSQKYSYVSSTSYNMSVYSSTDCSGTPTDTTTTFISGCTPDTFTSSSTEQVVFSWVYSQPNFPGGATANTYTTNAACDAKTASAITTSVSYPTTSGCVLEGSTYTKWAITVDTKKETTGYTDAACTTGGGSEATYTSCEGVSTLDAYLVNPAASSDDDVCFSGSETLLLESGSAIAIENVQVGDRVQVAAADGSLPFADVIFIPHERNDELTTFIEIQTATSSLKATPSHLVMAGSCGANKMLTRMEDVSVGDCMDSVSGEDIVVASEKALGRGIYSAITSHTDGIIVVNGFKASSFAVTHAVVNTYYQVHRAIYAYFPAAVQALAGLGQFLGSTGASVISA